MRAQANILLVEDDANLGYVIKDNLIQHGFNVDWAEDGHSAWDRFNTSEYDTCLIDIMLPGQDGFTVAEKIRKQNSDIPILFITAKGLQEDRIRGFELGGDDYITKPFSIKELIMRIEVFLKRATSQSTREDIQPFTHKDLHFDPANLILQVNGQQRTLTQMEADLLSMLCANKDIILRREEILKNLWGDDDYFKGRSLDVFITKLRKYLKPAPEIEIQNYHGIGFKLVTKENLGRQR